MAKFAKDCYHTQEHRPEVLKEPILCRSEDAWLGEAYYFWIDIDDAHYWGKDKKMLTGYYDIYKANIKSDKILNTVFDEDEYNLWIDLIKDIIDMFVSKNGKKPNLREANEYLSKRLLHRFDGMLFQDIPTKKERLLINKVYYRKRIQLAIYNKDKIKNFKLFKSKNN